MKKFVSIMLIIAIFAGVLLMFYFLNKPLKEMSRVQKEAAIAKILGRKPNLTDNTKTGVTQYRGKHVSFTYPASGVIYTQKLNGVPIEQTSLEYFSFDLSDPKLIFSMEVIQAAGSVTSLEDYPSVKLRQLQSNIYKQSSTDASGQMGLAFEKTGSSNLEKTGFFFLNGRVYSFSVQGNDLKAIQNLYNKIILSVKFL
ncbi:MAG: hypothetical protein M1444_01440 [Patescibacteria group bacterium]|nr:hypothetical protein [Patescibacteria group bacterium]